MSDSLRPGIAVLVEFTEGESPSPAKLNSITAQVRNAAEEVELAIGDIHGESWPYTSVSETTLSGKWGRSRGGVTALTGTDERKLDIASLGRIIGPASNLNPRSFGGVRELVETIPTGKTQFSLRKPVDGARSDAYPAITDPGLTNYVSNPANISAAGDYHVSAAGLVTCYTSTTGGTCTYNTNPLSYAGGNSYTSSQFNVLPDPNQIAAGGDGCTLSALDPDNRRTITLPVVTHQQSNDDGDDIELGTDDLNFEKQLELPRVLKDNFGAGEVIPEGFLYLKNESNGEVYTDATYYFGSDTTVLIGNQDLDDEIDNGHVFSLVTVGTDITTSIDDLRIKSQHTHDRSFGEPFVAIDGIAGFLEEAGNTGPFVPSEIPSNFAPQYLHRDGWTDGVDDNANDQNGMRGDLLFVKTTGDAGDRIDSSGSSYGTRFRDGDGPYIYHDGGAGSLIIDGGDSDVTIDADSEINTLKPVRVAEGLSGSASNTTIAPFCMVGTQEFETDDPITGYEFDFGIQPIDGILSKTWASVDFMIENPAVPNQFLMAHNGTTEWDFWVFVNDVAGVSSLVLSFVGTDWAAEDPATLDYRLVIWYRP